MSERRFLWRRLSPAQAAAVSDALAGGAKARTLASEYGVAKRTIYRAAQRAQSETVEAIRLGDWHADFAITPDGPVQLTPWYPEP